MQAPLGRKVDLFDFVHLAVFVLGETGHHTLTAPPLRAPAFQVIGTNFTHHSVSSPLTQVPLEENKEMST